MQVDTFLLQPLLFSFEPFQLALVEFFLHLPVRMDHEAQFLFYTLVSLPMLMSHLSQFVLKRLYFRSQQLQFLFFCLQQTIQCAYLFIGDLKFQLQLSDRRVLLLNSVAEIGDELLFFGGGPKH